MSRGNEETEIAIAVEALVSKTLEVPKKPDAHWSRKEKKEKGMKLFLKARWPQRDDRNRVGEGRYAELRTE